MRMSQALLGLAVIGAVLVGAAAPATAAPATGALPVLDLPAPTGPFPVGTTTLDLVDRGRTDPLVQPSRDRELMVRVWYPAWPGRGPTAPYQPPTVSAFYSGILNTINGTDYPPQFLAFPTHSRVDAPAAGLRHPLVLVSHDDAGNASDFTALSEELASRGYVVAGIDHTYDAGAVQFPDGRFTTRDPALVAGDALRDVRVADLRFVLDSLTRFARGGSSGELPRGRGAALDPTRVAAFGHGAGAVTVVEAMRRDPRIDAGAVLDGDPLGPAGRLGPLLMLGDSAHTRAGSPSWAAFHDGLRGPRLHVTLDGARHDDLSDITAFKSVLVGGPIFQLGPIDGGRSLAVQRAYLTAWFDRWLRGRPSPLLHRESPRYPEAHLQS